MNQLPVLGAEYAFLPKGFKPGSIRMGKPTCKDLGNGKWEINYPFVTVMYDERIEDGEICERCGKEEATEVHDDGPHVCHACADDYRMEE